MEFTDLEILGFLIEFVCNGKPYNERHDTLRLEKFYFTYKGNIDSKGWLDLSVMHSTYGVPTCWDQTRCVTPINHHTALKFVSQDKIDEFNEYDCNKQYSLITRILGIEPLFHASILRYCHECFVRELTMCNMFTYTHFVISRCLVDDCITSYCLECNNKYRHIDMCYKHDSLFTILYENLHY